MEQEIEAFDINSLSVSMYICIYTLKTKKRFHLAFILLFSVHENEFTQFGHVSYYITQNCNHILFFHANVCFPNQISNQAFNGTIFKRLQMATI